MPIEFGNPAGLGALGLLVPLVALYLLRPRRRTVRVPSLLLFASARRSAAASTPLARLTPQVSLLLQALALVLLALALGEPRLVTTGTPREQLALVVDLSASMAAIEPRPEGARTRLELAKESLRAAIADLPPGSAALLIGAGREARVLAPLERDRQRLRAIVDALRVREEEGRVSEAVALAADRLATLEGSRRVLLFTDGAISADDRLPSSKVPVEVVQVGRGLDNLGIVGLDVRREPSAASTSAADTGAAGTGSVGTGAASNGAAGNDRRGTGSVGTGSAGPPSGAGRVQVVVQLASFAGRAEERFVTLRPHAASEALASRRVTLAAGERRTVTLDFEAQPTDAGTGLVVELSPGDALTVDDRAYAVVPTAERLPVVIAPRGASPWLAKALGADPGVELSFAPSTDLAPRELPYESLVVVEGACPSLPGDVDVLLVHPPAGPCLTSLVGAEVEAPRPTSWAADEPRLDHVGFEEVRIASARRVTPESPRHALLRASSTTLIADLALPGRTGTLVGFDVSRSNWPLQASFVLFMRNVAEQTRARRARGLLGPQRTGEPLRVRVPSDIERVHLATPDGRQLELPVHAGLAVSSALGRVGLYQASWEGSRPASALVAANLLSPREGRLRRPGVAPWLAAAEQVTHGTASLERVEESGWLFALAALVVLALELGWAVRARRAAEAPRSEWTASPPPRRHLAEVGPARRLRASLRRLAHAVRRWHAPLVAGALLGVAAPLSVLASWRGWLPETSLRFQRPEWTLCSPLAVALALALLLRLPARLGRWRRVLLETTALGALLGASLAAAGLELGTPLDRIALVVAIDRSRSMDLVPDVQARLRSELAVAETSMRDDDQLAVVGFGSDAALETPLGRRSALTPAQTVSIGREATNLAAGLDRALAELPADAVGRVVLLSDGVGTRGDPLRAAAAARAAGVTVDVVPLDQRLPSNLRLVSLSAPSRVSLDEPLQLRAVVASPRAGPVEVRLYRDGELLRRATADVGAGEDVLHLETRAESAGLHRYEAALSSEVAGLDTLPDDNRRACFVQVLGTPRVLILDAQPEQAAPLATALRAAAFDVEVAGLSGLFRDAAELDAYDLLVLGDLPARDLAPAQLAAIASFVRDLGGGLLLLGGDASLGPGGYGKTPVEDVSPVSFDVKEDRQRASLAEVILVDTSGSMAASVGAQTKLGLANEAAARSAALLGRGDRIGVAHVDTEVRWTLPLGDATRHAQITTLLRGVAPGGGGIFVDLALREGYAALAREHVALKHLLLFADGSDAEERQQAPELVREALGRGVTTSVVALGAGADVAALERLSRLGGGRFYLVSDAMRLPSVFAQETVTAARRSINELDFTPSVEGPGAILRDVPLATMPELHGYVVTVPKPLAEVLLSGPEGDPVLATSSAGLGRSAVFTSDYRARWGREWTRWPGAAQLFAQLARDLVRRLDDPHVEVHAQSHDTELQVTARVLDDRGGRDTARRLEARVIGPDGDVHALPLDITTPGRHHGQLTLTRPGTYAVSAVDATTHQVVGVTATTLEPGTELEPTGTNRSLLAELADVGGGQLRDTLAGIFDDRSGARWAYRSAAAPLLWLSAALLLASVMTRRLSPPRALTQLSARLRQRFASAAPMTPFPHTTPHTTVHIPPNTTAPPLQAAPPNGVTARLLDARRQRRQRSVPLTASTAETAPHAEAASPAAPASLAPRARSLTLGTQSAHAAPPSHPPAPARGKSTAELLLARRKGRR